MNLCASFQSISEDVWDLMGMSRKQVHQLGEETITDLVSLALKGHHSTSFRMRNYTKPEEGKNGADWIWIFVEPSSRMAIGVRVQAKILFHRSDSYPQLHYTNRKKGVSQIDILEAAAKHDGVIPLYVLYSHWLKLQGTGSYPTGPRGGRSIKEYGCAIATTVAVRGLGVRSDVVRVAPILTPWQDLVCGGVQGGASFLGNVSSGLNQILGPTLHDDFRRLIQPRPITGFPDYLQRLHDQLTGLGVETGSLTVEPAPPDDEDLAGVMFFMGPETYDTLPMDEPTNAPSQPIWPTRYFRFSWPRTS